jgi:hypothetical protein
MKCLPVLTPLLSLLALALPAGAEVACGPPGVTATVDPQLAPIGESFEVTLSNNSSQTITLPDSCVYRSVYPNSWCGGTPIYTPYCLDYVNPIAPGQSQTGTWDQQDDGGQQVGPHHYSVSIQHDSGACCLAMEISHSVSVPALNRWGVSALVGFVGLAGIWAFQKRRAPTE